MMFQQEPHHIRMFLRYGPHQRRLFSEILFRVDIGSVGEQCPDGGGASRSRAGHQRSYAGGSSRVGFAPATSNLSIIAALPLAQASESGVTPRSSAAFALPPAAINRAAVSKSSQWAAQ